MALIDEVYKNVNKQQSAYLKPSRVIAGRKAVATAGDQERLVDASTPITGKVTIKALHTNTGNIFIGASTVETTSGFVLDAGESITLDISDIYEIWVNAGGSGEGVSYIAEV